MMPLRVDFDLDFIQQVRLVHALTEAGIPVQLRAADLMRMQRLVEVFGAEFHLDEDGSAMPLSSLVSINHQAPSTRVGSLQRPLLFPHAIGAHLRASWPTKRPWRFSFAGLVTEARKDFLRSWCSRQLPTLDTSSIGRRGHLRRVTAGVQRRLFGFERHRSNLGPLVLWESTRGRNFPIKAWDEQYFQLMQESQFVLCPEGDSAWTYRFFEASLCGAIPVVETDVPMYTGFKYLLSADTARNPKWDYATAAHNYEHAMALLTIPRSELRHCIETEATT